MKKLKISLAASAFILTIGASVASHAFTAGWYIKDKTGTYAGTTRPAQCNGSLNLCATQYDSNGNAVATANQDN